MSVDSMMPGCFGSPLCYSETRTPCSVCIHASECGVAAEARASRLKERYHLDAYMGQPDLKQRRREVKAPAALNAPVVNKKSKELIDTLSRRGIDLPRAIEMGINPFDTQPPQYMRIACGALMAGGFDRAGLRSRYVSELGWTDTSASSHVGIATGVLVALGVAQAAGDRMVRA